jgi:hypothetical protein
LHDFPSDWLSMLAGTSIVTLLWQAVNTSPLSRDGEAPFIR